MGLKREIKNIDEREAKGEWHEEELIERDGGTREWKWCIDKGIAGVRVWECERGIVRKESKSKNIMKI